MTFLPNIFILGAAKCGTTTMHAYLEAMPGVTMSRPKEPIFFECEFSEGMDFYQRKYFSHWSGESHVGEARHRNLYLSFVPERIWKTNPEARLIILLRNPVERAYSDWWHWYSRNREPMPFDQAIAENYRELEGRDPDDITHDPTTYCAKLRDKSVLDFRTYVDVGYYHSQIARYLNWFPPHQVKIVLFRDLAEKPMDIIREIQEFVRIPSQTAVNTTPLVRNSHVARPSVPIPDIVLKAYRHSSLSSFVRSSGLNKLRKPILRAITQHTPQPEMAPDTRAWLTAHYAEHNARLAQLIKRDLSHWN